MGVKGAVMSVLPFVKVNEVATRSSLLSERASLGYFVCDFFDVLQAISRGFQSKSISKATISYNLTACFFG